MSSIETHPSELAWSRHLSGELSWLAAWRLRRHLGRCAACRSLAEEQGLQRAVFELNPRRQEHLARLGAAAAAGRAAVGHGWRKVPWVAGFVAVGALLLFLPLADPPGLAPKGADQVTIYVDGPSGPALLGSRCAPGDRLMARFRTSQPYLLLMERDGQGNLQVLFPLDGSRLGATPSGRGDHALELDPRRQPGS